MDRVNFIMHKDRRMLHLDFAKANADELFIAIARAKQVIAAEPEDSIYTLTDVTDVKLTTETSAAIKELANHNKPYVKAGAVVGVVGIRKAVFSSVLVFTGRRNLHLHDSLDQAKDWLAAY